ncbi:MAG: 16S rRNA (cytosine(967)-C(5))-methyltransferase RsmB, partial [Aridibacter sp.]
MKISPARKSAFEILLKVEKEKSFSSILLPVYEEHLSQKDRSLCHEITLGVLRNKIYLDYIIENLTKKNLNKFDLEVLIALRLGIYQMIFLDKIPTYSAINESVNLVKFAKKKSASGLVNAVLRRASKQKFDFEFKDEIEKLSVETSHPRWLVEKWIKQFGFDITKELTVSNNKTPTQTFRFTVRFFEQNEKIRDEIFEKLEIDAIESDLLDKSFKVKVFSDDLRELAENGLIYFQDLASQIAAQAVKLENGQNFLDVCASPGSKTTLIAANNFEKKLQPFIVAGDLYSHRIETLKQNCRKQAVKSVNIVQYDAEISLPFKDESFDKILLDAPCSGTGTIRRNPEIRYFLAENDFAELQRKQLKILKNASKLLKDGGEIIYSTCSLETEENEAVIEKFLSENKDFTKTAPELPQKFLTPQNFARIFPYMDNT